MKRLNKLIIATYQNKILTALLSEGKVVQLNLEPRESQSVLNNIYIGKVKHIVKNINSAFVELGNGLMGYYSLTDNKTHHFVNEHHGAVPREGDEILVQAARDAVKTKAPVLTSNLSFTGKYIVLTAGKNNLGFSNKITDAAWKQRIKNQLEEVKEEQFGVIIRTNAYTADEEAILSELRMLKQQLLLLLEQAPFRTCYSLIYQALPAYVTSIRDTYSEKLAQIVTDEVFIYQNMKEYLNTYQPEDSHKLVLYQDQLLPLKKLHSLETAMEDALNKHVWLKSGGYLVIEQTEAMVVIDVNTGKYSGKKNVRETILKINLEAAAEIGKQLCLRNLSGIVLVDFIDMEMQEDKDILMKTLSEICQRDPVKTTVVDMTKLNLVEITRKKVRKPLHEQARE